MQNPQDVFRIGFIIVLLKFALGGLVIGSIHIPEFSGEDFAIVLAALGGIHSVSRHVDNIAKKGKDEPSN